MTATATQLTARLRTAHTYLNDHGWAQDTEQDDSGAVCLTGAIRWCAPQTGDAQLIRLVLRERGTAEDWNDDPDRTEADVLALLATAEITDADLASVFGACWETVVTVVRQAAALTSDQAATLKAYPQDALIGAHEMASEAINTATPSYAAVNALVAVRDAAYAPQRTARDTPTVLVAECAVIAAVLGDLLAPVQHQILMAPWRTVFPAP